MTTKNAETKEIMELEAKFTPTSLSLGQERALFEMVAHDPMQSGEDVFVLLALTIPARVSELLMLRWSDFRPIPGTKDCMTVALSNRMHILRTPDSERLCPLSSPADTLLMERKQKILDLYCEAIGNEPDGTKPNVDIGCLPVCCSGNKYANHGDPNKMISHLRERLLEAGVSKDTLRLLDLTMKNSKLPAALCEECPEIYLMRRSFATRAQAVGMTQDAICYMMDIPND